MLAAIWRQHLRLNYKNLTHTRNIFMAKKVLDADKSSRVERDELAELIVAAANKSQKDGSIIASFLDGQDDPQMVSDWISTGSTLLDLAISNRKNGGLPVGRIVELNGLEGTGKSLISAHILASTQKKGGLGVMIDTEYAAAPAFWTAVGVDLKNLPYVKLVTVEEIFAQIEMYVGVVRKSSKDRLCTIIVDSLAMASCETEMESEHGKDGYNTSKAIIISKALRKITGLIGSQRILVVFTNQLRMNMATGKGFGDKWVVPGGKAMGFAASVRVRLSNIGQLKNSKKDVIGNECKCVVTKNRMGPPKRQATFEINFDSGIQDLKSWLEFMSVHKLIGGDKNGWIFELPSGKVKLNTKEFVDRANTDLAFRDEVYTMICDFRIMKYRDPNSKIEEDIEVDENADDED
jgi:recombination protein RecA